MNKKNLLRCLCNYQKNQTIENWNKVISDNIPINKSFISISQKQSPRCAFLYKNPFLKLEYKDDVTITYFNNFYLQIIQKHMNNNIFNIDLCNLIDEILTLRKQLKEILIKTAQPSKSEAMDRQLACKLWLNSIFSSMQNPDCICKSSIQFTTFIVDTGRSIMSSIFSRLERAGMSDKIIYMDTDEIAMENFDISPYFKQIAPSFSFHTEYITKLKFFNEDNIKHRRIIYSWKDWFVEKGKP